MGSYIIFQADHSAHDWEKRKLAHSNACTRILAEHYYGGANTPKVGERVPEFVQLKEYIDPEFPCSTTHYKTGDWEVTHIEEYTPEIPISQYTSIFICRCKYSPIDAPLKPIPPRIINIDSFSGDKKAYDEYMQSKAAVVTK